MVKIDKNKAYFSTKELAEIFGISPVAIFKRIKTGRIKATKVGKTYVIEKAELAKVLRGDLTEDDKKKVEEAVKRTIKEYGSVLKLLGKE